VARHLHLLTCLLIMTGFTDWEAFLFSECWIGHRLYSSTRMRLCMYRTACAQYRLCFPCFTFPLSYFSLGFGGSGARRIHRWLAGVQRAPNGDGVTVLCFSRAVCALLSCCFELTNQINSNQIKTIAKSNQTPHTIGGFVSTFITCPLPPPNRAFSSI
jgi:hypothetical protein